MKNCILVGSSLLTLVVFIGCGKSPTNSVPAGTENVSAKDNHESWWCSEHGVPEEVCAQCNPKLAAKYKADGDWCKEHDRPESQCFICHPEYKGKFAAQYEAKYGKKPPEPGT
jgi:hypothetical protein